MAATRNLELAMRIALDIEQAQKALPVLQRGLASVKDAGTAAGAGLDAATKGADKAASALDQTSRSSAEAANRVRTAGGAVRQTVADEIRSISELDARLQQGAASMSELADTEAMLDRVMARGLITHEDYNNALKTLDKQEAALTRTEQQRQRAVEGALGRYDGASVKLQKLERDERELAAAVDAGRISREQYNRALAGINIQRNAVNLAEANNRGRGPGAISAGQYQMAMRQLPAQITDITTSIVSGMPIWMVAIQQGGQLKDSFGGVMPAARALAGAITPTVAVVGGLAVAVGGLALAWKQAVDEEMAFQRALIVTNNYAATSTANLQGRRDQLTGLQGVSRGTAAEALTKVAQTGRFTGEQFELVSRSAAKMQASAGQAIDTTVAKFLTLKKDPVEGLLALTESENFLTQAQLARVRALVKEGNQQEAVAEAIKIYSDRLDEVAAQSDETMPALARGWQGVKKDVSGAWGALGDFTNAVVQLAGEWGVLAKLPRLSDLLGMGVVGSTLAKNFDLPSFADLTGKMAARIRAASGTNAPVKVQMAGIYAPIDPEQAKATKEFEQLRLENLSKEKKLEEEIKKIRAAGNAAGKSNAEIKALEAEARARYAESLPKKPKGPKTEAQTDEAAAQRELERLKQEIALVGTLDETRKKATKTAEIEAAIKEGNFQNASAKTKQELLDTAKQLDSDRLRVEAAKKLLEVRDQIANLEGRGPDAQQAKSLRELEVTRRQMVEAGNQDGVVQVDRAKELVRLTAELQKMQETYNRAMGEMGLAQQRIQVELQAGLITEAQARQKLVDLSRQQLSALGDLPDRMRATAEALKNPEALQAAEQMAVKLKEMAATTNLLQQNVRTTFQSAFRDALMSLASGNATLGDVVRSFFQSIASGLAGYVADELSAKLASTLTGKLFGKGAEVGSQAAAATATQASAAALSSAGGVVTAGASAVTGSASALASAGGGLVTGAGALVAAAVQLKQAAIALAAANSSGAVADFAGGLLGAAGKVGKVTVGTPVPIGKAQGGPVWGPGTGTSDSIAAWLSNGEFVARAKVVSQPGALAFLHAFNAEGMSAVRRWGAYAFADGGVVSQTPSLQRSPVFSSVAAAPTSSPMQLGVRLINQVSPGLFEEYIDDPGSDKTIINKIDRNAAAIRQVLGL